MQCPNGCAASMKRTRVEKILHRNGELVVVSDLLMYVCPGCGQESMPLASAKTVENILNGKTKPSGKFTADLYETSSRK